MTAPIPCQVVSWSAVSRLVRRLAELIRASQYRPDLVVAIARGGFVPARLLCDHLGAIELASFRIAHYRGQRKTRQARISAPLCVPVAGKRVLVVDDLSDTGATFAVAADYLRSLGAREVRTAALHHKEQSRFVPDYFAQRLHQWRWIAYPWARIEDLSELIRALPNPRRSPAALARQLAQRHGLRVAVREVEDALHLMESSHA